MAPTSPGSPLSGGPGRTRLASLVPRSAPCCLAGDPRGPETAGTTSACWDRVPPRLEAPWVPALSAKTQLVPAAGDLPTSPSSGPTGLNPLDMACLRAFALPVPSGPFALPPPPSCIHSSQTHLLQEAFLEWNCPHRGRLPVTHRGDPGLFSQPSSLQSLCVSPGHSPPLWTSTQGLCRGCSLSLLWPSPQGRAWHPGRGSADKIRPSRLRRTLPGSPSHPWTARVFLSSL